MATTPEALRARQQSSFDLDAVDATETVPVPSLIYGGARAWGPAGDTDAELKNAYDSVNLVRSDLIREFESRGVSLARLERDFERARAQLVEAETSKSLAESDARKWRDAVSEMERQRDERARETREERARYEREDETRVRRCATLEAELAAANARLARAEEDAKRLEARNDALVKEKDEGKDDDADGFARQKSLAASARDVAEARAAAAAAAAETREARLECRQSALRREELERRLEQTESALRDAEGLVGEAEAAVAQARADAEAARGGAASPSEAAAKDSRIAELETALAALRGAAAQDAAAVAAARRTNVDAATVAAAEERASAERARAARAEARLAALEDAAVAAETSRDDVSAESELWRAALARVPGASSPADLADAVVRLEEELAAALGGGGEAAAAAAAAAATAAAATRRAEEAEEARLASKANEDELIGALARAERKVDLLTREKESLQRVVKSYDDEASKHAATFTATPAAATPTEPRRNPAAEKEKSPFGAEKSPERSAPETARRAELDASLRAAHERVSSLEAELETLSSDAAAARAAAAEEKANSASARAHLSREKARADALERETRALERRLARGEENKDSLSFVPGGIGIGIASLEKPLDARSTKVLHFKRNPEFTANETATERELATCRSECAALRETVARLSERDGAHRVAPTPETRVPLATGLATPFRDGASHTGGALHTPGVVGTPGSAVADAELTVARRRVADLEKREQRLMTAFKKQIYVFRESVRLLFGYKVDMSVDESVAGGNACVATLRSRFVSEKCVLRFAVEPARVGGAAGAAAAHDEGSVAILETPFFETERVRRMAETFVGKCGSVPAFLANLTMELFDESEMRTTRE